VSRALKRISHVQRVIVEVSESEIRVIAYSPEAAIFAIPDKLKCRWSREGM
jgi:hypothetical protein